MSLVLVDATGALQYVRPDARGQGQVGEVLLWQMLHDKTQNYRLEV
jgi:hypothetical protein